MIITVNWRPPDHELLQGASFEVREDNEPVGTTVYPGRASVDVSGVGQTLRLTITFAPTVAGRRGEVLRIEQVFERSPIASTTLPIYDDAHYVVLTGTGRRRRIIPGRHPFLLGSIQTLVVKTSILDITDLVPGFEQQMKKMAPRKAGSLASKLRIFARTDGVLPMIWLVATPDSCQSAPATDLLCFLGPSQNHGKPPTLHERLTAPQDLIDYGLVMLGSGTADGGGRTPPEPVLKDTFTPGDFILAKGFEKALVASGKHAALAIPIPANKSHNDAATAKLPGLLADVHALIVAVGDAHPPLVPNDTEKCAAPVARPQYALAAHSRGGWGIWGEPDQGQERKGGLATTNLHPGALAAGPHAYSDLILFEGLNVTDRLDRIARTGTARVIFIGYDPNTVTVPHGRALSMPDLSGRVKKLPVPSTVAGEKPPETAPLSQLAAHSPSLAHALTGLPSPPTDADDLFKLKHQLCTWSGDDGGSSANPEKHFLTQALELSSLR